MLNALALERQANNKYNTCQCLWVCPHPESIQFLQYSLIFAFSFILTENRYIFTYLISLSMQIAKNKYTYWK